MCHKKALTFTTWRIFKVLDELPCSMYEKEKFPSFPFLRSSESNEIFFPWSPYEAVPHIKRETLHLSYNTAQ